MAAATAPLADHAPTPVPRRATGKASITIAAPMGRLSDVPIPWKARATMSTPVVGASAAHADATVNTVMPAMRVRRRPHRSPSTPPITRVAAPTMEKELMTHDSSASLASGNDSFRSA